MSLKNTELKEVKTVFTAELQSLQYTKGYFMRA